MDSKMMMLFEKGVITIIRKIREESEGWQIDFASLFLFNYNKLNLDILLT